MARIHLLDNLTADQIAAGEVIERPASVIKELVENALDAGALNISVEITDGGLTNITITDDGCGMSREDVMLAIKRHATSKLLTIDDLDELRTLGFRGEALPSIAAVSKTVIKTRERPYDHGTKMLLEGSTVLAVEPVGAPFGTAVNVSDLFFNTPARKKFMRTSGYEAGLIHEMMIHFAFSHPIVNFRFLHQDKEILNTKGINSIPDLVELFYGHEARKSLITLEEKVSSGAIQAYITAPGFHRSNRKAIHFFVNNRKVLTTELMKAVEGAYENLLPKARFPLAIINLNLEPSLLDVNVHPGKLEIRFKEQTIITELQGILEKKLSDAKVIPGYTRSFNIPSSETAPINTLQETFTQFYTWKPASASVNKTANKSIPDTSIKDDTCNEHIKKHEIIENTGSPAVKLPDFRIIGQLDNTFILGEGDEGLYLIDQHAAHERILFDRMLKQAQEEGFVQSQVLLTPIPLQLTVLEEELLIEYILPLTDMGIILEHFGPRSYLLRSVPAAYTGDPEEFFFALIEKLSVSTVKMTAADTKKEFLIMSSCKGAIKAGQKLSANEIEQLLKDLNETSNPLACPHGRPIFILISHHDILKAFQRK